MNAEHLRLCSSAEWSETVERSVIPWVLDGVDLGDDVLEVGPGPGLTTDVLRAKVQRLTAVEIHSDLAAALDKRLVGTNVDVVCADASDTALPRGRFSGAVCLTMLHHVPSIQRQNSVLAEIYRLLRPGGILAGEDSLDNAELRTLHHDDTYVPVDPSGLPARLEATGFIAVVVDTNQFALRFHATKPFAQ